MLALTTLILMAVIALVAGLYLAATTDDALTHRQKELSPVPDRVRR